MIYFANPTTRTLPKMTSGGAEIGYIATPNQGNPEGGGRFSRPKGVTWVADNGCFGKHFDVNRWYRWLKNNADGAADCQFATAPDVVGDHEATLKRSLPWLPKIRELGFPAALVIQDGATIDTIPWDEFDAAFIGGTTEFKLGETALEICREARRRGKWVHIGRVNSRRRYMRFTSVADSVDGTCLIRDFDRTDKVVLWVREHRNRLPLWEEA